MLSCVFMLNPLKTQAEYTDMRCLRDGPWWEPSVAIGTHLPGGVRTVRDQADNHIFSWDRLS